MAPDLIHELPGKLSRNRLLVDAPREPRQAVLVPASAPQELCAPASAASWGGDAGRAFPPLTAGSPTSWPVTSSLPSPSALLRAPSPTLARHQRPLTLLPAGSPDLTRPCSELRHVSSRGPRTRALCRFGKASSTGTRPGPLRTFCPRLLTSYTGNAESLQEGPPAGPQSLKCFSPRPWMGTAGTAWERAAAPWKPGLHPGPLACQL